MLRLLGAAGVFAAISWMGIDRGQWYVRRCRCLEQWCLALLEGERILCDLNCPTEEFLGWMSGQRALRGMAERCMVLMEREERLQPAWTKALAEACFPLREEELGLLAELGQTLGRYDGEEQRRYLRVSRQRLENHRIRAEEERHRLSKMWSVVGVSCGVMAVVVLL